MLLYFYIFMFLVPLGFFYVFGVRITNVVVMHRDVTMMKRRRLNLCVILDSFYTFDFDIENVKDNKDRSLISGFLSLYDFS